MRRSWILLAILIPISAGMLFTFLMYRDGGASQSSMPSEISLFRVSLMPQTTGPVAVPSGYEAAAWDPTGRVTFWKWTATSHRWRKVGNSTYPILSPSVGTSTVKIIGALLTGMTNATFIAQGQFSGDGTADFIAFTAGSHGWGVIAPGPGYTLIPTGRKSTNQLTPGNSLGEFFHDGHIVRSEAGSLSFGTNGDMWQVVRTYSWDSGAFHEISTSQYIARFAPGFSAAAPPFPTEPCRKVTAGTYLASSVSASTTFTSARSSSEPYLPKSVAVHVEGQSSRGCSFSVSPNFSVVISAITKSGTVWITAPAWVLTRGAHNGQNIGNLLPGTRFPGQYGFGALEFQSANLSPYYIPRSLGILQVGKFGSPIVTIHAGRLTKMIILPS